MPNTNRLIISLNYYIVTGRIAAKRQTAGIKFTQKPKIIFFSQYGRLVATIHVKLGRADGRTGIVGPLGCAKLPLSQRRGGNAAPKMKKCPLFVKESPRTGEHLERFVKF